METQTVMLPNAILIIVQEAVGHLIFVWNVTRVTRVKIVQKLSV
jgi:hypothetical protein